MTRKERFQTLFPAEPAYRWKQIEEALFREKTTGWQDITNLPEDMRGKLQSQIPFFSYRNPKVFISQKQDTHKALLELEDTEKIETVLMSNKKGDWTICVSSQVGCAMKCGFCATGKMGLKRNLESDEIIDQYRFWKAYLRERLHLPQRISNVVFMGMGEPLANFENVKHTLNVWLRHTDLGPTRITVSTVGLLPLLEKILADPSWPHVRLAVSLHSADEETRKKIVPTSAPNFIKHFESWGKTYLKTFGNRKHHLTFEYVMLRNVNDTEHHAKKLFELVKKLGQIKVNLIPYNFSDTIYQRSEKEDILRFKRALETNGVTVTIRKTMGDDIAAACGQLIVLEKSSSKC